MPKQDKHQPFTLLGTYEWIDELSDLIGLFSETDWNKFTFRQKTIVGHKHTQTIPLMFDYQKKTRDIRHEHYLTYAPHLGRVSAHLATMDYPSMVCRANLVRLLPQSEISAHIDRGEFLNSTRRIHIPVATNEGCIFTVGEESKHLPRGEMWEINNTGLIHSVTNGGDTPRIHLIVDVR